jgi:hypothetical protein
MTLVASSEGNDEFQIELSQPPIIPPRRDEEMSQKQQQQRGSRPRKKSSERNKRHGARNQHRHKFFIKWLLKTFNIKEGQSESSQQQHILDVAGYVKISSFFPFFFTVHLIVIHLTMCDFLLLPLFIFLFQG